MVGIGFSKKGKITLEASYGDSELDTAIAMGESLARHGKREVIVYLYKKGKPKVRVLKRIKAVRSGFMWLGKRVIAT
jgi:hypothetical protein